MPNLLDDAHDVPLQVADAWLAQNLRSLISSPAFQNDGLLIIVFDEGAMSDASHGGGHVAHHQPAGEEGVSVDNSIISQAHWG